MFFYKYLYYIYYSLILLDDNLVFIQNDIKVANFSVDKENYVESFKLSGLSAGYYLYDGYLRMEGKRVAIQRYFTIKD